MFIGISLRTSTLKLVAAPTSLAPVNTTLPTISGTPTDGSVLTATPGTWSGTPAPTFAYVWKANDIPISGATASTYTLNGNAGSSVTVTVTATNSAGTTSATSAPVSISPLAPAAPDMSSPSN